MIINHNLPGMNAINRMNANAANASKSMTKLSSGLRINNAADDAAGLAISEKMRGQIRGLDQASANAQDGISMIQTGEGALAETQSILQRMRELAVQSSNDTNNGDDRTAIQTEMNQLSSEINRIGNTTEFNTQKLLKGTNQAAVTTTQSVTTDTAGVAGVVTGSVSALTTGKNSVVAVASTTSVQGNQLAPTGTLKDFNVDTASEKGTKSSATLANGLVFTSKDVNGTLNNKTVEIKTGTGTTNSFTKDGSGNYTITIGEDNTYTTAGELYNAIKATTGYSDATNTNGIDLAEPANTAAAIDMTKIADKQTLSGGKAETLGVVSFSIDDVFKEAGDTISIGGKTFTAKSGGATAANGEFDISTATAAAQGTSLNAALTAVLGDKYTVADDGAGKITLTEVATTADGVDLAAPTTAGAGADDKLNITNLSGKDLNTVTIIKSTTNAGTAATTGLLDTTFKLTAQNKGTELNGVKIAFSGLTESAGGGGASALTSSWDAATRTLTVTGALDTDDAAAAATTAIKTAVESGLTSAGFKDQGTIVAANVTTAGVGLAAALNTNSITFGSGVSATAADTMSVEQNNGELTIHLADTTASKNTAAKIQEAVQKLGTVSTSTGEVDFSKYEFSASGNWDTKTVGENIVKQMGTFVGGTEEVDGEYTFSVDKMFAAGDVVDIKGQKFTAVASGADATKGQFNVGADVNAQAAGLRAAINANSTLSANYTASGTGADVKLTENAASGVDMKTTDLAARATGTAGQYEINLGTTPQVAGAKFVIDGTEISVSDKTANVGYANGTAIKADAANQTSALADAINTNAALKDKYTASVDSTTGNLVLTQKELYASSTAPDVKTISSTKGDFSATMQIGANTEQSLTVSVSDMRSAALGITGDGSSTTVAAKNGKVASYLSTKSVTDGTSNTNTEFALDISTDANGTTANQKATAAISVLDDAISAVSTQRAKLGAYQNRLEHTIANLGTSSENLTSAESRIRDVDMAKEMSTFSKNNILSQAAQAMLAQANQQPQQVLQLLR